MGHPVSTAHASPGSVACLGGTVCLPEYARHLHCDHVSQTHPDFLQTVIRRAWGCLEKVMLSNIIIARQPV